MKETIVARDLCKRFVDAAGKGFNALDGISLTARAGQLTALVGPDGAGKTTFMRMACGLLKADGGSLQVLGRDVHSEAQAIQDRISYMPQRFGLYEDLSVAENLNLYADLHGVPAEQREKRFGRLLAMTDLARFTARPAGNLSGGMKQKLGLACTLVRSPELLLLDEPSVGVDPLSRRDLWEILTQLVAEEDLSVVVSTAYMDEAERCDQILVMHRGQLLAEGTAEELRQKAKGLTYFAKVSSSAEARQMQAALMEKKEAIIDALPSGGELRFVCQPNLATKEITALLPCVECRERPAELEDAFMMLLHAQDADQAEPVEAISLQQEKPAEAVHGGPESETKEDAAVDENQTGKQDNKPIIFVRNLLRKFGDFTAVDSTSFDVQRGEIFGLLGPNGAGKTTTFRMLCGLLPASGGELEVAGHNLRTARARARGRIGYVAQKFSLYGNLSVAENLKFFAGAYGLRGKSLRRQVDQALGRFQLDANAISGELPGGFKQRLAMAAALLHEPDILFLDEPTSGIDPLARRLFWRSITDLAVSGVTIIITTHFMEEAEYCDRIAIQDAGQLLALGTPKEVRAMAEGEVKDMNAAFIAIVEQSRAGRERGGQAA